MQNATQSRTLEINGMAGDACVTKVTNALKDVRGVVVQSVKVGTAMVTCDQTGCDAACQAIKNAGYTAREAARSGQDSGNSVKAPQGETGYKATSPSSTNLPNQSIDAGAKGKTDGNDSTKNAPMTTPAKPVTVAH